MFEFFSLAFIKYFATFIVSRNTWAIAALDVELKCVIESGFEGFDFIMSGYAKSESGCLARSVGDELVIEVRKGLGEMESLESGKCDSYFEIQNLSCIN